MDGRPSLPQPGMRLLAKAMGVLLLCWGGMAQALTVQLLGAGPGSEPFVAALREKLGDAHQVVLDAGSADVVVALHEGVLAEARAQSKPRLLLLPEPGLELQQGETALYWSPSLTDQLRLARHIMPGLRRVGLLVSPRDLPRAQALRNTAQAARIELLVREAEPALLARQVAELAATADVLLAPVDPLLFSRESLKPVLLAAYRQNRVFVGPTPAWVRAGSLASLYATPQTLAHDVAQAIHAWQQGGRWPAPAGASRFDVITNPQVARSMGLRLPETESLTRLIQGGKGVLWP
ncbi:MAG: hypothetical protein K0Q68_1821 [Moraxellaceae bacterium]|nr:hypothetical protein [Moraxellaceae bacterium]